MISLPRFKQVRGAALPVPIVEGTTTFGAAAVNADILPNNPANSFEGFRTLRLDARITMAGANTVLMQAYPILMDGTILETAILSYSQALAAGSWNFSAQMNTDNSTHTEAWGGVASFVVTNLPLGPIAGIRFVFTRSVGADAIVINRFAFNALS